MLDGDLLSLRSLQLRERDPSRQSNQQTPSCLGQNRFPAPCGRRSYSTAPPAFRMSPTPLYLILLHHMLCTFYTHFGGSSDT